MARVSFREAREVWSRLVLEGIPELGDGRWRAERLDLLDVSSHYKNLLYFGRLTYCVPDSRRHRIVEIVVKVSTAESARSGFQGLETLWVAGFRAPSRNQVPRPLGIIEQQGALVMERARGQRWLDALASDTSRVHVARRVAEWLLALQSCNLRLAVDPLAVARGRFEQMAEELAARVADARLARLGGRLDAEVLLGGPSVPTHGDFHPKNVFYDDASVTAFDCERLASGEAAADIGWAIGQLLVMSFFHLGGFGPGADAARAFWDRYAQDGQATWDRVRIHVARTFFVTLHYAAVTLANPATVPISEWIDLIEGWLVSSPDLLDALRRPSIAR